VRDCGVVVIVQDDKVKIELHPRWTRWETRRKGVYKVKNKILLETKENGMEQ